MIVYADVLFLTNFIINIILIEITSAITKNKGSILKKIIASSIGAIYAVCMFVPEFKITENLFSKFILSLAMTGLTYKGNSIKSFAKFLSTFYLVSLVSGGLALSFTYFSPADTIAYRNGVVYFNSSFKIILISSLTSWIIIRLSYSIYKKHSIRDYHRMVLYKNGKAVPLNVLLDTGNMLKDPISMNPVIIVEKEALRGIIPAEINTNDIETISAHIDDIRLIPFKSLGVENGILVGFKPDKICSKEPLCENITIAISNQSLGKGNEYNALAGPECFIK